MCVMLSGHSGRCSQVDLPPCRRPPRRYRRRATGLCKLRRHQRLSARRLHCFTHRPASHLRSADHHRQLLQRLGALFRLQVCLQADAHVQADLLGPAAARSSHHRGASSCCILVRLVTRADSVNYCSQHMN